MSKGKKPVWCELCGKEVKAPRPKAEHHFCARCWENNGKSSIKIMMALRVKKALNHAKEMRLEDISS